MELTALESVVCIVVSALLGYAAPTVASPFRADRDGLPCDTVPRHRLRSRVHPLMSLALLLSSSCLRRPEHPSRLSPTCDHGRLPWGSTPLRDISPTSPRIRRASQAHLRSVRSVSRALDGLLLAVPCRLVSFCCHVQVLRFRGFLPRPSRTTSSVARTSSPLVPPACHRLPDDASRLHVDLEVLIRIEIRSTREVFSLGRYPRPLVRFAPSGFAPPVLEASLLPPPLGL
jgi:hypothetical protein